MGQFAFGEHSVPRRVRWRRECAWKFFWSVCRVIPLRGSRLCARQDSIEKWSVSAVHGSQSALSADFYEVKDAFQS